jgi:hypothetical protein
MNLFNKRTYTWWQIGLFKVCLLSLGIIIGANWSESLIPYTLPLLIIALMLGGYIGYISFKK